MAWTETGGDVLFIEASLLPGGRGQFILTGQLGDVMQESARAAVSHIRANARELGVEPNFLEQHDLHVHVPAGAIPKDGPSAGVTMATAILSAARGEPVREDVAMTGEITLSGLVLPVGGIREKALAAKRFGLKTFILPALNEPDLKELPEELRKDMTLRAGRNARRGPEGRAAALRSGGGGAGRNASHPAVASEPRRSRDSGAHSAHLARGASSTVVFYISGHGFGHASRSIEVINALLTSPCERPQSSFGPRRPRLAVRSHGARGDSAKYVYDCRLRHWHCADRQPASG